MTLAQDGSPERAGGRVWTERPFYIAGGLKIAYDLLLYRAFVQVRPPEEQ